MKFHVPQNSFYITIKRIAKISDDIGKYRIKYFYKSSGKQFASEARRLSIYTIKSWEIIE